MNLLLNIGHHEGGSVLKDKIDTVLGVKKYMS